MTESPPYPVPKTIKTKRLLIQPFTEEHAASLHEALEESIEQLREYLWFIPWIAVEPTLETAQIRCQEAAESFRLRTDMPFLMFSRTSGHLIGSVGLHRTDWHIPKTEVGFWIRTSETGNGYAAEAVASLVSWSLEELQAKRVELVMDEENVGSRRIAEKCGFVLEGIRRNDDLAPDGSLRHNCVYAKLPSMD